MIELVLLIVVVGVVIVAIYPSMKSPSNTSENEKDADNQKP